MNGNLKKSLAKNLNGIESPIKSNGAHSSSVISLLIIYLRLEWKPFTEIIQDIAGAVKVNGKRQKQVNIKFSLSNPPHSPEWKKVEDQNITYSQEELGQYTLRNRSVKKADIGSALKKKFSKDLLIQQ
jgi:hypothetical protein